nr:hypothetical protein [uncultured Lachnoclostridium sp.]
MLKERTEKILKDEANKELEKRIERGINAEIVYVPVVIERDNEGKVGCITSFTNHIIPSEN